MRIFLGMIKWCARCAAGLVGIIVGAVFFFIALWWVVDVISSLADKLPPGILTIVQLLISFCGTLLIVVLVIRAVMDSAREEYERLKEEEE